MEWSVSYHEDYLEELHREDAEVQVEVIALVKKLEQFGPLLHRPHCGTLSGSKYTNMKELRFSVAGGVWRVAFAFDPRRKAMLLVGGSKSGISQQRFYRDLIRVADERFEEYLRSLEK